ncbi:MAG: hypothetical protein WBG71_11015 [Leeuwenhoekiella sp.]
MKILKNTWLIIFSAMLLTSCSEEDIDALTQRKQPPSVTYSETTLQSDFYTAGNSAAPTIDWNGDQGTLSLQDKIEGIDINTTTGVVSWSKLLEPGTHDVVVVVSNSEGQTSINMTIINEFEGIFVGTYNSYNPYLLNFLADGTIIVNADGTTASGTWSLQDDGTITAYYVYDGFSLDFTLDGELIITTSSVILEGNWYDGDDTSGGPVGNYSVILE